MNIVCPLCRFEREVDPARIPQNTKSAKCPDCGQSFPFSLKKDEPAKETSSLPPVEAVTEKKADLSPKNVIPLKAAPEVKPTAAAVPKPALKKHSLDYKGSNWDLFKIHILNNLLTVLTLGVYHFWGKAKIRKYLFGSTELMGERFNYSGTGKELFVGWLKASAVMVIVFGGPQALSALVHPAFSALIFPLMLVIVPVALVSSRRYRLSRIEWHGARFAFKGSVKDFIFIHLKGSILTMLTFGLYAPYFHAKQQEYWLSNSHYGTGSFKYTGAGKEIRGKFLKMLLLWIPTFGLYWFWYKAWMLRYDWEHTSYGDLRFSFKATGSQYFGFQLANLLLIVFTLGVAMPLVAARTIRFTSSHLSITGEIEFGKIGQVAKNAKAVGEGISGILDMDMAL